MQSVHTAPKTKAFGYVRVSTLGQTEHGDSLETQRRAIELVCELEGFELVGVYADPATSGSVPLAQRDGGAQLLAALEPGSIVVGVKLDRLFRDASDATGTLKQLKRRGVGLYLKDLGGDVTASNVSALVFGLLSNVAEFERSRIAERIRDVKATQRAASRYLGGGAPFGYTLSVDPDSSKQVIVPNTEVHELARKLKREGYSSRLAAGAFAQAGYPTTHTSVQRLWRGLA